MTNADKFKQIFGLYATELWSKTEGEFLIWLNSDFNQSDVLDTNVDDTISRQAAIDAVIKRDANCGIDSAEVLKSLPSAQQWIPCSERPPKEFEPVLGTFKFQGGNACLTTERIVVNGEERWSASCGMTPIAWMPRPAPYKEGEG